MPRLSSPLRLRPARCAATLALAVVCAVLVPASAEAAGVVSTTGTTTESVRLNSTTALAGLSVSDTVSGDTLQVTLSTDLGTLTVGTTTGLTLDYGYSSYTGSTISFTGSPAAVNTAVGTVTLAAPGSVGTAHVSLSAMVSEPGYVYSPTNGHFYTFVSSTGATWSGARSAAANLTFHGQAGYLASMPSAATNDLVANRISGATNAWIGAKSTDTPGASIKRTWKWDAGPIAGQVISSCTNFTGTCDFANNTGAYASWASSSGEPNNYGAGSGANSGEWVAVTNWNGTHGAWNDLPDTTNGNSISGYIVEFGDRANGSSGFAGVPISTSSVRIESPPDAPTAVSAVRGDQSAQVSFTPGAANSNSSPITSYTATATTGSTSTTTTCYVSPCSVTGLTNGSSYTFTLTATNAIGTSAASAASAAVVPAGVPAAPTGVTAAGGNQQAIVSFTAPAANGTPITGYTATASSGGVRTTSACSASPCTVTGLTNGTPYVFTLKATNAVGSSLASDPSDAVTPAGAPTAPTSVTAVRGNQQAQVSFTAPANNGSPITGYTVTSAPGAVTATCTLSPCTVTGLTNGTAYTFTATATNAVGTSTASAASGAATPAAVPDAPTGVTATRGDQQAVVTFSAPSANGTAISGYSVAATSGGATTTSTCTASPCTITGLTNGSAYVFTVKATNAVGTSPASAPSDAATPAGAPTAPTGLSAVRGNQSAQISFTVGSANGSPITGYTATSSPGGLTGTCTVSPCTVTALTNGTPYTFTVTATNATGTSAASTATTAVTPAAVPNPPTAVTATGGDQQAIVTFTPPSANGTAITGYTVNATRGGVTATSSCPASPCTVSSLTNGSSYVFTVKATNAVGTSLASDPTDAVTPAGVPAAPTGAGAVRGNQSAQVSFTPGSANGSPITGYTATSSPGGATGTCSVSPCVVTGLTNGTAYTFAVTATNAIGTSAASAATTAVSPAAVPDPPTAVTATRGDQQATVSFTTPATNGTAITDYSVAATTGGSTTTSTCTASPCTITGLSNGSAYVFTVKATNTVGSSPASDPTNAVTPAGVAAAPTSVGAVRGNQSAQVSFTAGSDNGSPITGYTATSSPGGLTGTCTVSPCTVTALTNGTPYTFTVTATNATGTSAASAATTAVTPAAVPDPPTGVVASRGDQQVDLTFATPADNGTAITGYTATATTGGASSTAACTASPCTVTGLANGTAYVFTLRATNAVGTSPASDPSDAVTPAGTPSAPTPLTAVRGNQAAQISFTAGSPNGSPVTTYTATSTPGGFTGTCSVSPCTVSGLTNGTAYTFTLTATNAVATSADSTASGPVTPAAVPDPPAGLAAARGDEQAVLTFATPADNGTTITGYTATATSGGASSTAACTASPCTVTGLTNGSAYVFTLTATNTVGVSPASAPSDAVTPAGAPSTPVAPNAVRGNQSALVSFAAPADHGSPITTYTVTAAPGGLTATCTVGPCTVTGLTNGTAYTFTVAATNAVGTSPTSAASDAVTPAAVPDAPIGLQVVSLDAAVTVSFGPPASDGGSTLTGYQVSLDTGQTWTTLTPTGTTTLTAPVTGLVNGTAYVVRVRAMNAVDHGPAVVSSSVTPARAPGAVTSPSAVAVGTAATVTWTAPSDTGGAAVVSYVVTSTPASTTCTSVTTSCTLSGLSPGTSYVFSVRADNTHAGQTATGTGPGASAAAVLVPTPATTPPASSPTPAGADDPGALTVQGRDRSLVLSFTPPPAPVTGYQVSLDAGQTWNPLTTTGTGPLSATITPVLNGRTYAVQVRATTDGGPGAPTAVQSVTVEQWYADPVSKKTRTTQVDIPKQPGRYLGRPVHTKATKRSAADTAVTSMSALSGRQLQAGQGVQLSMRQLFTDGSNRLSRAGRARLTSLASSLAWVGGVNCEGYTDYSLGSSVAKKLSAQRARTVCTALRTAGVRARMVSKGYGGARPQVIGGPATLRRANNRIVLLATDG